MVLKKPVLADEFTMKLFREFLIYREGFGWMRNPKTEAPAGVFISKAGRGRPYEVEWHESYGAFVIPNGLTTLFKKFSMAQGIT